MSITAAALKRDRVTLTVVVGLCLAGVLAYQQMPRAMDPGFVVRTAVVVTTFPGASPDRVEQLVTVPIENAVQELAELKYIASQSRAGASIVTVGIRSEFSHMDPIWTRLRRKVDDVALPSGANAPEVDDDLGDTYGIIYTMTADGFSPREQESIADAVRDELLRLPDVAKVDLLGVQPQRIFVNVDQGRLARAGLSPGALQGLLASRNIIMPGGKVITAGETIILEPSGAFDTVDDIRRQLIPQPDGNFVELQELATIERTYIDPPEERVRSDGHQGIGFAVAMRDGGNLLALGERVRALFDRLPAVYPHGIDFHPVVFEPTTVESKIEGFTESVLQAVVIILVVMLLALGLRTGVVVAALVPSAIIITILLLNVMGVQIDQMSLAALMIALGLLVDNAIVVTEAVLVRAEQGASLFDACVATGKEMNVPLLTASLTTAAAFLPIALAESTVGEYTGVLFSVVTTTLLVSWLLALTFIPLLATWLLKVKPRGDGQGPAAGSAAAGSAAAPDGAYARALYAVIRWRWPSLVLVVVAFVGGMKLFGLVPAMFFPPSERPTILAGFERAPGTAFAQTEAMTAAIDGYIARELARTEAHPDRPVTQWTAFIGEPPPNFVLGYKAQAKDDEGVEYIITVADPARREEVMRKLERFAVERFPDVRPALRPVGNGPPVSKAIEVRILGPDRDTVFGIVDRVTAKLKATRGVVNVADNWGARTKKLTISIDEDRARRAGLSHQDIARSLQSSLSGLGATEYREGDQSIPVVIRSDESVRNDVSRLETLDVFDASGQRAVPLRQVADVRLDWQYGKVLRRDRVLAVTVEADITAETTALGATQALRPWLDEQARSWPVGYRYELGGESDASNEANASIVEQLPLAGLLILALLMTQFNSVRRVTIVLSTIPLALIGVGLGLLIMDSYFGFMTLLGVISLAGIVINNGIVLIDRIDLEIAEGRAPLDAIVVAAQQRTRPILLTTATTVASLIPLYLTGGAMWEPMTVAIMFGLLFSTVLTLGFVPLMYALLFRVRS